MADTFRPATLADAASIVPHLRACDVMECEALAGKGSAMTMAVGTVAGSPLAFAYLKDDRLVSLFGVAGKLTDPTGKIWAFGTNEIDSCRQVIDREIGGYLKQMFELFPKLENVVDARNTRSIKWLKHMGFTFHDAITINGFEFLPFDMEI